MRARLVAAWAMASLAAVAAAAEPAIADRWNLADLYASVDAWNADAARVDATSDHPRASSVWGKRRLPELGHEREW